MRWLCIPRARAAALSPFRRGLLSGPHPLQADLAGERGTQGGRAGQLGGNLCWVIQLQGGGKEAGTGGKKVIEATERVSREGPVLRSSWEAACCPEDMIG